MFDEALKDPDSFLYFDGKVEITFIGYAHIESFDACKSGTYKMGIYKLSETSFGFWSGSALSFGFDKKWSIKIVKKV